MQTFAEGYNPAYVGEVRVASDATGATALDARKVIARRAAMFLKTNAVVNLGIGIPRASPPSPARKGKPSTTLMLTVEGGCRRRRARRLGPELRARRRMRRPIFVHGPYQFDRPGLDQAFLGLGRRPTARANVNVSRFGRRRRRRFHRHQPVGHRSVCFLGTFTAGADILRSATARCASAATAACRSSSTRSRMSPFERRAPMRPASRCTTSPAPRCGAAARRRRPRVDRDRARHGPGARCPGADGRYCGSLTELRQMDAADLHRRPTARTGRALTAVLDERVDHHADDDLVFIDFEGLTLSSLEQAEEAPAAFLGPRLHGLARRVERCRSTDHNFELAGQRRRVSSRCSGSTRRYFLSLHALLEPCSSAAALLHVWVTPAPASHVPELRRGRSRPSPNTSWPGPREPGPTGAAWTSTALVWMRCTPGCAGTRKRGAWMTLCSSRSRTASSPRRGRCERLHHGASALLRAPADASDHDGVQRAVAA